MQRLRELRGVSTPAVTSIPLQSFDYRALRQKDLELEEETEGDALNVNSQPQLEDSTPLIELSTISSIAAAPWIVHVLLVLVNIFTFAYLIQRGPSDAACLEKLSPWSPAIDAGAVHFKIIPFNGSKEQESRYRGSPSAEIDSAWANITSSVPQLRLTAAELGQLKKPTDGMYKDETGYAAQLEIYELLGCLDQLRKASYRWQYPELREGTDGFNEDAWHQDLDHCIETLRMELMCTSNVNVLTYRNQSNTEADFTAVKKCRNFDELLAWSNSQQ